MRNYPAFSQLCTAMDLVNEDLPCSRQWEHVASTASILPVFWNKSILFMKNCPAFSQWVIAYSPMRNRPAVSQRGTDMPSANEKLPCIRSMRNCTAFNQWETALHSFNEKLPWIEQLEIALHWTNKKLPYTEQLEIVLGTAEPSATKLCTAPHTVNEKLPCIQQWEVVQLSISEKAPCIQIRKG